MHATNPHLPGRLDVDHFDEAEKAERFAWRLLINEANGDFDSAELALASRIQNLFNWLAPDGMKVEPERPGELCFERAVRHGGNVYTLNYDPA